MEQKNISTTITVGSARRITDNSGNVIWSRDFYPFGEARNASGSDEMNKYTYEGKEKDLETDQFYNWKRYFNEDGRFTQVDPLWQKYPSMSPYVRVANNPLRYVDPDGNRPLTAEEAKLVSQLILSFERQYSYETSYANADRQRYPGFTKSSIDPFYLGGLPTKQSWTIPQILGMMIGIDVDPNVLRGTINLNGIKVKTEVSLRTVDEMYITEVSETGLRGERTKQKIKYFGKGDIPIIEVEMDVKNYEKLQELREEWRNKGIEDYYEDNIE